MPPRPRAIKLGRGASRRSGSRPPRPPRGGGTPRAVHRGVCPLASVDVSPEVAEFGAGWEREQDEDGHVRTTEGRGAYVGASELLEWLALHSGDPKLMTLVWRALSYERRFSDWRHGIVTVRQPVIGYDIVDGEVHERLGEAEIVRWTEANDDRRAHAWRRLLMYLAGHTRAASLSRLLIENAAEGFGTAETSLVFTMLDAIAAPKDLGGHPKPANDRHLKTGQR